MATQVQYRRGTNAQNTAFTGALGEITVDTTNGTLRVHDGITAGGSNIATVAYVTAQIGALSSNSISFGTSNVRVTSSGGNVATSVGGTSNVVVVASTGQYVTGVISATGSITTAGDISITGNIVDGAALTISTNSNGNITLNPDGTGVIVLNKDIINGQANGTGNIGSSTTYFNTVFAKATSAQYADLAEMYVADGDYLAGTVIEFGGTHEVTISTVSHSPCVAGVVSTRPSYLMNATQAGDHVIAIALVGRVPCNVIGPISKGDRLVASSIAGVAQRLDMNQYQPGCIIGKALQDYDSEQIGSIEIAVGRF